MKNTILTLMLFGGIIFFAGAQTPEPKYVYCTLTAQGRLFSTKVTITIDFGDRMKAFADNRLKDKRGKPIIFNTAVDALNFMGSRGWELVQAYSNPSGNDANNVITTWILKKSFMDLDDDAKREFRKQMDEEE